MDDKVTKQLNIFRSKFKKMTYQELIELREREYKTPGWTNSRSVYLTALREVINKRCATNKQLTEITFIPKPPASYRKIVAKRVTR